MQWILNIFKRCKKSQEIDITKLYQEYEWVKKVINSCTTIPQLLNAQNLVDIWYVKEIRNAHIFDNYIDMWDAESRIDKLYDELHRILNKKLQS